MDQFSRSFDINSAVGIQNAKGEPTCDLFELFDTSSHLLEFCICIDKITSTWTDHNEHWNNNLVLDVDEGVKIGSCPSKLKTGAEQYDPL